MEFDLYGNKKDMCEYYKEDYNFYKLYEKKFIIRTIIGKLAAMFSNVELMDVSGKETDMLKKLQNPNKEQSTEEFLKDFAINLFSSGYSIIWKKWESFGVFDSLELIVISTDQEITDVGKSTIKTVINGKSETIKKEDLLIFYDFQKSKDSLAGISRLRPFKTQIENVVNSKFGIGIQMENSGTTVVSPKASPNSNSVDEGLNAPVPVLGGSMKTQKQEMEDRLNSRGIKNRIIVSNKGLDAKNLSAELNSFSFSETVESDVLEIYDLFSFAPELTPYGKNATFENKPAAENKLIEAEIIPLAESLIRSLNQDFKAYGQIQMSYDHINSVASTKNKFFDFKKTVAETYVGLFEKGLIERDEARNELLKHKIIEQ